MRHLQRSRSARSQGSLTRSVPTLTDIALDAMGSDKAPDPEIKGRNSGLPSSSGARPPGWSGGSSAGGVARSNPRPGSAHRDRSRSGMDHDGRKAANAIRKKPHSSMRVGLRLVKEEQGGRLSDCGQYRRRDGPGQDGAGATARRGSSFSVHLAANFHRLPLCAARCGRKCRLQAAQSGAICRDGRNVRPQRA